MLKCNNEERLVKEAANGNTFAFSELVHHYEKFVFNVANSYMSNYDDAFDVAQDSFIKAWNKLSTFKGDSSFSTWLYRITVNSAKDALALRNRRWNELEADETLSSHHPSPEQEVIHNENLDELRHALNALEPEMREILVLREFENMSYVELAEHLSIELGTVKSRISRARTRLCEIFMEQKATRSVKTNERK